jgi:hypothetical protein
LPRKNDAPVPLHHSVGLGEPWLIYLFEIALCKLKNNVWLELVFYQDQFASKSRIENVLNDFNSDFDFLLQSSVPTDNPNITIQKVKAKDAEGNE